MYTKYSKIGTVAVSLECWCTDSTVQVLYSVYSLHAANQCHLLSVMDCPLNAPLTVAFLMQAALNVGQRTGLHCITY